MFNLGLYISPRFKMLLSSYLSNFSDTAWSWWPENNQLKEVLVALSILTFLCYLTGTWAHNKCGRQSSRAPPLPPGPRGLPLVGNLPFLDPMFHTYLSRLAQTYGSIMKLRLGNKTVIVVSSAAMAHEVLKDHDVIFANRDKMASALAGTYGGRDVSFSPYGPEWRALRKILTLKMLSNITLNSVYPLRRKVVRQTVRYLYSRAGSPIDIGDQAFAAVFNVVTSMAWGNTVKVEEMMTLGQEFRHVVTGMMALAAKPNVSDFYPSLARFDLQGIVRRTKDLANRFDTLFDTVIDKRIQMDREGRNHQVDDEVNSTRDFLQYLLRLKTEGDSDGDAPFTMTQLKALLLDMVAGGTDTSTNVIEFAMADMIKNPKVMSKAQQELEQVVGKDKIVEESHIHHLPYLKAVVKESLRLHPAVPLLLPHCPSETCVIGGYTVPKDSRVLINAWAIHHDPSTWQNPSNFDPERFAGADNRWDFSGNDLNYIPFGSGRRICPGTAMAERLVLHLLATLVHSFEWNLQGGDPEHLDVSEKFGINLKKKEPLVAIPTPRLADPVLYE